jgi:hypothetical protein
VQLVLQEKLGLLEILDQRVNLELLAIQVQLEQLEQLEQLVIQVQLAQLGLLEILDQRVNLEQQVPLAQRVHLA